MIAFNAFRLKEILTHTIIKLLKTPKWLSRIFLKYKALGIGYLIPGHLNSQVNFAHLTICERLQFGNSKKLMKAYFWKKISSNIEL